MRRLAGPALAVPFSLFRILPRHLREVVLLAYLCREAERKAGAGGWFPCPSERIGRSLPMMTPSTLSRSLRRLEEFGLIDVRKEKQFPFALRLRLNGDALSEAVRAARR